MRTVSAELRAHFVTSLTTVLADLFTVTLADASVFRWTSYARDIATGGYTWTSGGTGTAPIPSRERVREVVGLEPAELEVTLAAGSTAELGTGVKLQSAAIEGRFDGARVQLLRAYLATDHSVIGTIIRFDGQVSDVRVANSLVRLTVRSDLEALNLQLPRHFHRPLCSHAVFDAGCGVSRASYTATSTVSAGSTTLIVNHALGSATDYYKGGSVTFTSGALSGIARTIIASTGTTFTVEYPLASAPAAGDGFTAYPGCDKSIATCRTKFLNIARRRGFDFIPAPEMVK